MALDPKILIVSAKPQKSVHNLLGSGMNLSNDLVEDLENNHNYNKPTKHDCSSVLTTEQQDKLTDYERIKNSLTLLENEHKDLKNKEKELKKWPNTFGNDFKQFKWDYQQLLVNQEKHTDTDLKPANLPADWENKLKELKTWKNNFGSKTAQQIKDELDSKSSGGVILSEDEQEKLKNYDTLKKERDSLLIKLNKKPKESLNSLGKKISEEINKAYRAPKYLFAYYLKLIKTFQDWEVMGNEEQKEAFEQNKSELTKVIKFLNNNSK